MENIEHDKFLAPKRRKVNLYGEWAVPSLGIFTAFSRSGLYRIFYPNADTSVVLGMRTLP